MSYNYEQGNGHKVAGTQEIQKRVASEIITQNYWPEDIANALRDGEMWFDEAKEAIVYELGPLFYDITDTFEGAYFNWREVIENGLDLVRGFLNVADEYGLDIGEWPYSWYLEDVEKLNEAIKA